MTIDTIDRKAYLEYSSKLKPEERSLQDNLMNWLPNVIIDSHTHCNLPEHVCYIDDRSYHHIVSTFPAYSLAESTFIQALLFPGKIIRALRFPNVLGGIDHRAANEYLLNQVPPDDRVAIFGLPNDINYTINLLRHSRTSALKMYYTSVEPPADRIYDFFRPEILDEAQRLDRPIILHLPWAITASHDDLMLLLSDFPRLRVVLAHLGLTSDPIVHLSEAYAHFAPYRQIVLDTSLVQSIKAVQVALTTFGPERIMFGSDEPFHLIRSITYEHPILGERLITEYRYHWVNQKEHREYRHLAVNIVHCLWQNLNVVREAIELLPLRERLSAKRLIFHDTAETIFGF